MKHISLQPIIDPVDPNSIEKELKPAYWVRKSHKGSFDIYIITAHECPSVMKEIGRLRELSFRSSGGGTGKALDIDNYDTIKNCYRQLIVYDASEKKIVGGYRFIDCATSYDQEKEQWVLSTSDYFRFQPKFTTSYLPYTIELGRSWVQPEYQPGNDPRKGIFALSSLWDGLGALVKLYPHIRYFFGKVTMYPDYPTKARDLLLSFMHTLFPDSEDLVQAIYPLQYHFQPERVRTMIEGMSFEQSIRKLKKELFIDGVTIPPLIGLYMGLSPTMKTFDTAVNPDFGGVEETGILISISDIYEDKKARHVDSFILDNSIE